MSRRSDPQARQGKPAMPNPEPARPGRCQHIIGRGEPDIHQCRKAAKSGTRFCGAHQPEGQAMPSADGTAASAPRPGETWKPGRPGSGPRTVRVQHVDPDPSTVSFSTPGGVHRRISLSEWSEWVQRWQCEVQPMTAEGQTAPLPPLTFAAIQLMDDIRRENHCTAESGRPMICAYQDACVCWGELLEQAGAANDA